MRRCLLIGLLALGACKSRGTITLDFDLEGGSCPGFGGTAHYVLYAEPRATCSACACGACAGIHEGQVLACPSSDALGPCTSADIHSRELDLTPGVWAVVVDAYDGMNTLLATQCLDVTVDADGVASTTLGSGGGSAVSCTACSP